jgi:hypothetical protein
MVDALGRPLEQRTTLYGRVTTVGKRLRPAPEPHAPSGAVPVVLRPSAPVQA